MEQRRTTGKGHWYHETQSSSSPTEALALVPEAARVDDPFCLDLVLPVTLEPVPEWLIYARHLALSLLPDTVETSRLHTLSSYDRLSTALTVAQVYGVQRLCNHYAARLAPQPGPDSSRESNHRLTQITQYARQLASQPTLITPHSREQLEVVGLSCADIVTFHHIIGFIGFQARAVAALQALSNITVRWLPGLDDQQEAESTLFLAPARKWQAGISAKNTLSAVKVASCLQPLADMLAWDETTLTQLNDLTGALIPDNDEIATLCELTSARLNGCVARFADAAPRWRGKSGLPAALCHNVDNNETFRQAFAHENSYVEALRLLTLSPARFSTASLTALRADIVNDRDIWQLLAWSGLCGWLDRLYGGPGSLD